MKATPWSIGELAHRFGLPTHVLRHWEDQGLLTPGRDGAGHRRYGTNDLVRVAVIQRNKSAGMSLPQIRVLLDEDAEDRGAVLRGHLREIETRLRDLERSRAMTEHALRCEAHNIVACPHFASYVADVLEGHPAEAGLSAFIHDETEGRLTGPRPGANDPA